MKLVSLSLLAAVWAVPAQADWKTELANFQQGLGEKYQATILLQHTGYSGAALATCGSSIIITGAAFIADTLPVANGLSEIVGNTLDEDYQTQAYESFWSWESAGQLARGTAGGGIIGVAETLEFVALWLAGNGDQSFEAVKKMYASSFATADSLFAEQGKCMMHISKVYLLRNELVKRAEAKAAARRAAKYKAPVDNGVPTGM